MPAIAPVIDGILDVIFAAPERTRSVLAVFSERVKLDVQLRKLGFIVVVVP